MVGKNPKLSSLTLFAQVVVRALCSPNQAVSFTEVYDQIDRGELTKWFASEFPGLVVGLPSDEELSALEAVLPDAAEINRGDAPKEFRNDTSGLHLLLDIIIEAIAQGFWREKD